MRDLTCRELDFRLERLLDGDLAPAEAAACARHLAGCAECRELAEAAGWGRATDSAPDLVGAVLGRTSGPACEAARERLCALVDGELAAGDGALVELHLDGCPGCRETAAVLRALARELSRRAAIDPGAPFTAAVLRATLPLPVRVRRFWQATWPRWVRRPRFAAETAFVGLLAVLLVFGNPARTLASVPGRVLERAGGEAQGLWAAGAERLEDGIDRALAGLGAWSGTVAREARERRHDLEMEAALVEVEARELAASAAERARTWLGRAASLLVTEGPESPTSPTSENGPSE